MATTKLTFASVVKSVADFYKANSNAENQISATQLTQLVQLVTDNKLSVVSAEKTVRGYMRSIKLRNQAEYRGATWRIIENDALTVVQHFAASLIAS